MLRSPRPAAPARRPFRFVVPSSFPTSLPASLPAAPPAAPTPPAAPPTAPTAPATAPRRPRVDRLTVLNWLAFLAILGMTLGEGCAMQSARRREERVERAERARAASREACDAASSGVALAVGAPEATDSVATACAGRPPAPEP